MPPYPYTIENGAGERLTFHRRIREPGRDRLEGEARVAPGAGPPMHVHYLQDEGFTVVSGRLGYEQAGRAPAFAQAGESVVFRAGDPHRFWNDGEDELHCEAYIEPAGNAEYFLAALFASQRKHRGRRPGILDVAFLSTRYRAEYAIVEVPRVIRRLVFPVLAAVGRTLGSYRKYADAPEALDG